MERGLSNTVSRNLLLPATILQQPAIAKLANTSVFEPSLVRVLYH
jgi:hypothetical protein